jgi:hypothetical protein
MSIESSWSKPTQHSEATYVYAKKKIQDGKNPANKARMAKEKSRVTCLTT